MHTINVNTATRESDEQFKTDKYLRYAVIDSDERQDFIPALFATPSADNMARAGYASIPITTAGYGLTGLFRRESEEILRPTASSSSPRRPDISRRKVSSVTGCAFLEIILRVKSAPMQQELLPR
nr:Putative antirestriction protein [Raoultella sp. NCTC 9187]